MVSKKEELYASSMVSCHAFDECFDGVRLGGHDAEAEGREQIRLSLVGRIDRAFISVHFGRGRHANLDHVTEGSMNKESMIPWVFSGLLLIGMSYLTLTLGHPESFLSLITVAIMVGTMMALRQRLKSITEPLQRERMLDSILMFALMGVMTAFASGAMMLGGHHPKRSTTPTAVSSLR